MVLAMRMITGTLKREKRREAVKMLLLSFDHQGGSINGDANRAISRDNPKAGETTFVRRRIG